MIDTPSVEQVRKALKSEPKPRIVKAHDDAFNRKVLEQCQFDVLLSPEVGMRRDSLRQLDSGFNHVLAAIAAKKGIAMGIDLSEIAKLPKKDKAMRLARVMQNIAICRKASVKIYVHTDKDNDIQSFLMSLGASTQQAVQAISF